jgi:hypothetical protein
VALSLGLPNLGTGIGLKASHSKTPSSSDVATTTSSRSPANPNLKGCGTLQALRAHRYGEFPHGVQSDGVRRFTHGCRRDRLRSGGCSSWGSVDASPGAVVEFVTVRYSGRLHAILGPTLLAGLRVGSSFLHRCGLAPRQPRGNDTSLTTTAVGGDER